MLQREHSAILSTYIKLPFVMKNFVLSIFEWQLKTGFTVLMAYDVFSKVRGLNFGLSLHQHPYFVYMSSEGSGESAHMLKLRRILAAH